MYLTKLASFKYFVNTTSKTLVLYQKTKLILNPVYGFNTSSKANSNKRDNPLFKYLAVFAIGAGGFFLANKFFGKKNGSSQSIEDDPTLNLDLNVIYEKTAIDFLANPELREVLGIPIKITAADEIDAIRTVNLRREGSDVYSFIAYAVQGSQNSGIVYCKLKMDKDTQIFKTESILLKLSKPDSKKRNELVIKSSLKEDKKK